VAAREQGLTVKLTDLSDGDAVERNACRRQGIADLMAMPSAGDLVIYGIDAPEGHVSFIPEVGAHAGTSPEEMHTFIVRPAQVSLPSPITHPLQLYDHFIRDQEPS
jgi:hypothetical protein